MLTRVSQIITITYKETCNPARGSGYTPCGMYTGHFLVPICAPASWALQPMGFVDSHYRAGIPILMPNSHFHSHRISELNLRSLPWKFPLLIICNSNDSCTCNMHRLHNTKHQLQNTQYSCLDNTVYCTVSGLASWPTQYRSLEEWLSDSHSRVALSVSILNMSISVSTGFAHE